jgi:glutamate--cysteine ligase
VGGIVIAFSNIEFEWLKELDSDLLTFQRGIEKEGLRVNEHGELCQDLHPQALGSALAHEAITTDYAESLLEFITPVFKQNTDALHYLSQLHKYTLDKLPNQSIWAGSMPPFMLSELSVRIAEYGSSNVGLLKHYYRHGLWHRYGRKMQAIAGLHYNFSVPDALFEQMAQHDDTDFNQDYISDKYFGLLRNFRRYSWLLTYLFGASPAFDNSFDVGRSHELDTLDNDTRFGEYATSWRMSDVGYSSNAQSDLYICFNSVQDYSKTLTRAINKPWTDYEDIGLKDEAGYRQLNFNVLQIENEYYSDIRPKRVANSGEKPIHALAERGVEYVEVRSLDLNPFEPLGISLAQTHFIDLFLCWALMHESPEFSVENCNIAQDNLKRVIINGRDPALTLQCQDGEVPLKQVARSLIEQLQPLANILDQKHGNSDYQQALEMAVARISDVSLTPSAKLLTYMKNHNYTYQQAIFALSQQHKAHFANMDEDTQLSAAFSQMGIKSIKTQQQLEMCQDVSFDDYLARYLAQ